MYSKQELNTKSDIELISIAAELGIPFNPETQKEDLIDSLLKKQGNSEPLEKTKKVASKAKKIKTEEAEVIAEPNQSGFGLEWNIKRNTTTDVYLYMDSGGNCQ